MNESPLGNSIQPAVSIRPMTRDDYSLADHLLAEAFAENQITRLIFGDGDSRSRLKLINRRSVRNRHGSGLVAEVSGRAVGVLLYSDSPHCEPGGFAAIGMMVDVIRAVRWRVLSTFQLFKETERNHPKWPHRHLTILGVAPEFQSNGVGSALLTEFCRIADEADMSCYLETDSAGGQRLYERFGFNMVSRLEQEKVPFIYMWRQGASQSG